MTAKFEFVYIGDGIPSVLTATADGAPAITLAGKESGCRVNISGIAKQIRLSVKDDLWGLVVTTENGIEISTIGKTPVFSDYEIKLRSQS